MNIQKNHVFSFIFKCFLGAIFCMTFLSACKKNTTDALPGKTVLATKTEHSYQEDFLYLEDILRVMLKVSDPGLHSAAVNVQKKVPQYRAFMKESFIESEGKKVDYILQIHDAGVGLSDALAAGEDPAVLEKIRSRLKLSTTRSQILIADIIRSQKYDLVALEGSTVDGSGIKTRAKEFYDLMLLPESADIRQVISSSVANVDSYESTEPTLIEFLRTRYPNTPENYLKNRVVPDFHGNYIATEDYDLNQLHNRFGIYLAKKKLFSDKNLVAVYQFLGRMRSQYAVAKTLSAMKKHKYNRSALVFGGLHKTELQELAIELRLDAKIWDASDLKLP